MSAAEPATPTPPTPPVNARQGAAVIDLVTRRAGRAGAPQAAQGRWTMTQTPPPPGPEPGDPDTHAALRLVADDLEQAFNAHGRTLSDDETAAVFTLTLGLVEHALQGAAVNGIITGEERAELAVLIGGMKQAPRLV